jgi:hypothetical protein
VSVKEYKVAAVLLIACAGGVACGLARLKVWIIIPASVIFLLVTVVLDSWFGIAWSRTILIAVTGLTLFQVSYLIEVEVSEGHIRHQVSGPLPKQQMLRTVQMAIASELQAYFIAESLDDLPQHLRAKVEMLESA